MNEKQRLEQIVSGLKPLLRLDGITEFKEFRQKHVEGRLLSLLQEALSTDLSTNEGKDLALSKIWQYKELRNMFETLFELANKGDERAREKLKKI